ncbi:tetratricopeptide repeat protein [Rhodococcus koreensis]
MLTAEFETALTPFDAVLTTLPSEAAPKLALAATAEVPRQDPKSEDSARRQVAEKYDRNAWRTARGVVSAAFAPRGSGERA